MRRLLRRSRCRNLSFPDRRRTSCSKSQVSALWFFDAHCCHMGTAIKHPVPDRVKPSCVIFLHPGTLTLSPGRRSARMSKITHDGLTRSGWHRMLYGCSHMATVGVKRLNKRLMLLHIYMKQCENLNTLILYRTESHLRWTEFFTTCPAYGSIIHVKLTIQPVSFHTVYSTHSPEICVKPGPVFAAIET